jgi:hypothetical protein
MMGILADSRRPMVLSSAPRLQTRDGVLDSVLFSFRSAETEWLVLDLRRFKEQDRPAGVHASAVPGIKIPMPGGRWRTQWMALGGPNPAIGIIGSHVCVDGDIQSGMGVKNLPC